MNVGDNGSESGRKPILPPAVGRLGDVEEALQRIILNNLLFFRFNGEPAVCEEILRGMDDATRAQFIIYAARVAEEYTEEPEKRAFLLSLSRR